MRKPENRVKSPTFWTVPGRQREPAANLDGPPTLEPGPRAGEPGEGSVPTATAPEAAPATAPEQAPGTGRRRRSKDESLRCAHCRSLELHREPKSAANWLLFQTHYQCNRCNKHQNRFQLSGGSLLLILLLAGSIGGGSYLVWGSTWLRQLVDPVQVLTQSRAPGGGQLSAFEEMMVRRPKSTLSNPNIVELSKAGVRSEVIIRLIRASNADYDLRANAIIELKRAGVDESVILTMIDQSYGTNR